MRARRGRPALHRERRGRLGRARDRQRRLRVRRTRGRHLLGQADRDDRRRSAATSSTRRGWSCGRGTSTIPPSSRASTSPRSPRPSRRSPGATCRCRRRAPAVGADAIALAGREDLVRAVPQRQLKTGRDRPEDLGGHEAARLTRCSDPIYLKRVRALASELSRAVGGGGHGVQERGAHGVALQLAQARGGGAAGRRDRGLQRGGALVALGEQARAAEQGLEGERLGDVARAGRRARRRRPSPRPRGRRRPGRSPRGR